jgi:aspartyl-tRNA(Asn)/glutamyl-tRNA(Gln) amidotransferase subunit A
MPENNMNELFKLTLVELTQSLHQRKLSPVELMDSVLKRIDEANPELNAIVATRDRQQLMADARAAEQRLVRNEGRALEGIPLGVKDLEDAEGLPNTKGSLPFKNNIAKEDTVQVTRLRNAGAIVVGKTNAPEFGYTAITKNLVYGVTRSPWDLSRTPGGSSGGSAAALAAGILPLVTASDGGGSIRIPASFTGAFGLKTSYGRIPNGPQEMWNYGDTSVSGPLTRTVEDAALFLDNTVGPSPLDPNSLPHPGISYAELLRKPLAQNLRIGFSPDLGYAAVQSDIAAAVEEGVKAFEKLGHSVRTITGGPPQMGIEWAMLGCFLHAAELGPMLPKHESEFGHAFLSGVKMGWDMTPERFGKAARMREQLNRWCADVFEQFDVLVTPTVPHDPPPAKGPFPRETEGRKQPPAGVAAFTIPFNMSWNPAATVRVGLSRAGLPMGMQIVAPRHRDDLALIVSFAFQQERPWHPHWPWR